MNWKSFRHIAGETSGDLLATGNPCEDVLAEFPDLGHEDLLACLEFAARSLKAKSRHLALT